MLPARKHPLRHCPPPRLARLITWPFAIVVGGAAAMLALAAATAGLNPIAVVADFLADAAVDLIPLVLRLLAIWAIYTILYLLLAWDVRFYAPRPNAGVKQELCALVSPLRLGIKAIIVVCRQQCQTAHYHIDRAIPSSAWSPGTHPQIE